VVTILEQTFRDRVGGVLVPDRLPRRLRPAEEATQEAFAIAAERWLREGYPSSLGRGW
jgi:predicted RNA polymerase sigma factor